MATGPYRRHIERPPACDLHAEVPSTDRCARCAVRVCDDCLAFAGSRVVCVGCARGIRRRGAALRAIAAVALAVAGAAPGLLGLRETRADWSPPVVILKAAILTCETGGLDLLLSSFVMSGRDREVVAIGDAFAAECEVPAQTAHMVARARARLASP